MVLMVLCGTGSIGKAGSSDLEVLGNHMFFEVMGPRLNAEC